MGVGWARVGDYGRNGLKSCKLLYPDYHSLKLTMFGTMNETRSQLSANNGILVCLIRQIWQFKIFAGKEVTSLPATRGEGGYCQ